MIVNTMLHGIDSNFVPCYAYGEMADEFVQRVSETIRDLKKDIAGIDSVIRDAEERRAQYRAQLGLHEQGLALYRQVMNLPRTPQQQLPLVRSLRGGTIAAMCAQIIEARGGPVTVRELVDALRAAGKFKNPENDRANYGTVFGTLQRDDRFGKTRGKGEFYLIDHDAD